MKHILVGSKHVDVASKIRKSLPAGYDIENTDFKESCMKAFQARKHDFLFIDLDFIHSPDKEDYKKKLQPFWQIFPDAEIVILTDQENIREAVQLVKAGASDYLTYSLNPAEIKLIIQNIEENIRMHSELDYLRSQFWRKDSLVMLRTNAPAMHEVFEKVRAVARTDSTVLITGETGTGKGVIARLIHQHSTRSETQFINVHCGAIPETLLESELFGHEKGAFTGAVRRKLGKFEIAHRGSIFLDEIGTISAAMQIKLLQVLQDKTFQRVGGEVDLKTDVRIIAATNADLAIMEQEGLFRNDLYYRLNVFPIEIPPLRERIEDITLFTELFLKRLNKFYGNNISQVHPEVIHAFQAYDWPGNIRELENLVERAYILETSSMLTPKNFPLMLFKDKAPKYIYKLDTSLPLEKVRRQEIERIERQYISDLLMKNKGKINITAEQSGIGVRQLHKLMTKYDLHKNDFKESE